MPTFLSLLALAWSGPAQGWESWGYTWPCDEPIPVALYDADPDRAARLDAAAADTVAAWQEASGCPCFEIEYRGLLDSYTMEDAEDEIPTFVLGDPLGLAHEDLWKHWEWSWWMVYLRVLRGMDHYLLFSEDLEFVTLDELDDCESEPVFEALFGHFLGHTLGLAHSCEEDDLCDDEALREAAMFWRTEACSDQGAEPMSDDLAGLIALYGERATIASFSGEGLEHHAFASVGRVPQEVCFEAESSVDLGGFTWEFGDGASAEGAAVCHAFTEPAVLDVELRGLEQPGDCPVASQRLILCDDYAQLTPPLFDFSLEGLTVRPENLLPRVDNACTELVRWELRQEGALIDWSQAWEAGLEAPAPGSYTISLQVEGMSGSLAEEQAVELSACACASGRGSGAVLGLLLAPLVLRRRRRTPAPAPDTLR
jgi:hypothetical protein